MLRVAFPVSSCLPDLVSRASLGQIGVLRGAAAARQGEFTAFELAFQDFGDTHGLLEASGRR